MLDDDEILNIIGQELSFASGGNEQDFIDANRKQALAYYLGQPDGREVAGRSAVVSTDVADAIEWIVPEVMKALTKNNEVVTFDAEGDGDEDQARLESEFVYKTLMADNDGFIVLHQIVKDTLLQKNGPFKVYYDQDIREKPENYTGISTQELESLLGDDSVELLSRTDSVDEEAAEVLEAQWMMMAEQAAQQGMPPPPPPPTPMVHDVRIVRRIDCSGIKVVSVPPEEFRVSKQHNDPNPQTARFCAHVVLKTASELRDEGVSQDIIDELPRGHTEDHDRNYRWYMQNETVYPDHTYTADPSQHVYEISECYMHIDINDDGISEFMKIRVAGDETPTHILDMEEMDVDDHPFGSAVAILMPHKFFGLSIFDRLQQIQDMKTTLWRNILDNVYLQNNQRLEVVKGRVELEDAMISRPGGIIRVDEPGMVNAVMTPQIGKDGYMMMEYIDQVRAGRVGVSPDGTVTDSVVGSSIGSEGVDRIMTQQEELVGMIIRTIAETGIKPLMTMIRDQLRKHVDVIKPFRFRGQWVNVRPSDWRDRRNATVRVGTGSGSTREQQAALSNIMMIQEKLMGLPGQVLVTQKEIYNSSATLAKMSGIQNVGAYFVDPDSQEGQQAQQAAQQQGEEQRMQQMQAEAITLKAQADIANAAMQEAQAKQQANALKAQVDSLKLQLEDAENRAQAAESDAKIAQGWAEIDLKRAKIKSDEAVAITKIELEAAKEASAQHSENKASV